MKINLFGVFYLKDKDLVFILSLIYSIALVVTLIILFVDV